MWYHLLGKNKRLVRDKHCSLFNHNVIDIEIAVILVSFVTNTLQISDCVCPFQIVQPSLMFEAKAVHYRTFSVLHLNGSITDFPSNERLVRDKHSSLFIHSVIVKDYIYYNHNLLIRALFCQLAILSTSHFVNLPFCQLVILSTCHFVNLPFFELAIFPTCHFVNLPFCQLAILPTCHFVNLPFS
jgi:hypothetical protein